MVQLRVDTTGLLIGLIILLLVSAVAKHTTVDEKTASPKPTPVAHASYPDMKKEVAACSTSGTDYVLITDRSGSMKDNNKGVLAQQAAKNFIDKISGEPGARVGLVSFEDVGDETTDLNLTTNFSQAKSVIDGYVFTGLTCTRCGINLARQQFDNNGRAGARKEVILLTDGMPWHTDDWYDTQEDEKEIVNILNVATTHWNQIQMQIYAIGLGTAKFQNFLPDLVAISGGQSYITTDGSQLNQFYNSILADLTPTGGVTGSVFNDTNSNNQINTGESKLSGWVVTLNPGGLSRTTDSSGNFNFANICDGTYTLALTLKSGWFSTGPASVSVTVQNGQISTNRLFGVLQGYTVSGNVYIDANRNGVKDTGEANYSGATINRGGASSGSTTTDGSGNYAFGDVAPGSYTIAIVAPAGYQATTTSPVSLTVNGNASANFGIAPLFSISGHVFLDANRNSIKDTGETSLQSVVITRTGLSAGSTVTDASGNYSFTNLTPGNYSIAATPPVGYMLTTTSPVARTIGPSTAVNFGIAELYSVSGNVFVDANKDGFRNNGEVNFTGTPTVTASRGTVTTAPGGYYTISNLTAGPLTVSFSSLPADYYMTYPLNGPPPTFQITVGPGCNTNAAKGAICQ